jgi:hypothetical protein
MIGSHLPRGSTRSVNQIKAMAGIATLVMLFSIFCFALLIRLNQWPNRGSSFNVWINLPTFDPTTGGDVVKRLRRDSLVNVILGVFAPFVLPVVAVVAANHIEINVLSSPHALVWGITLWMFIPLSMLMRGPGHVAGRGHDRPAARAADGLRCLRRTVLAGLVALASPWPLRPPPNPPPRRLSHRVVARRAGPAASRYRGRGRPAGPRHARDDRRRGGRYLLLLDMDFDAGLMPP